MIKSGLPFIIENQPLTKNTGLTVWYICKKNYFFVSQI